MARKGKQWLHDYIWCNCCDPHTELACHDKWHPGTSGISTPKDITEWYTSMQDMALNYPSIFNYW